MESSVTRYLMYIGQSFFGVLCVFSIIGHNNDGYCYNNKKQWDNLLLHEEKRPLQLLFFTKNVCVQKGNSLLPIYDVLHFFEE